MSITNLTSPYSTPYQVSADDIDLIKIRSLETSPLTHEDLDDNFANLMNKVNALVDIIGGSSAAISVDGDGNVGIGTANPESLLHIASKNNEDANGDLTNESYFKVFDNATSGLSEGRNGGVVYIDANYYLSSSDIFSVSGRGENKLTIKGSGNVGIGTTNPSHTLEVRSPAANETASILIAEGDGDTGGFKLTTNTSSTYRTTLTHDDVGLVFNTSPVRPYCFMDGNVGIGTTNPSSKITAISTVDSTFGNVTPSVSDCVISLANQPTTEAENNHASLQFNLNAGTHNHVASISLVSESAALRRGALAFCTDNGANRPEAMRIDSDGNVGIGTTDPDAKLEVAGSAIIKSNGPILVLKDMDGGDVNSQTGFISYRDSTDTERGYVGFGSSGTKNFGIFNKIDGGIVFGTGNNTGERMRIDPNGNVGIGTTSPFAKLHLQGSKAVASANVEDQLIFHRGFNSGVQDTRFGALSFGTSGNLGHAGRLDFKLSSSYATPGSVPTNLGDVTTVMTLDGSGKVGIGTTSPGETLEISTVTAGATAEERTSKYNGISILTEKNGEAPYNGFGGGIVFNNQTYTNQEIYSSAGIYGGIGDNATLTGIGGHLAFHTSNTKTDDPTEKMRIDSAGNVGIGTTNPASFKLNVQSDSGTVPIKGYRATADTNSYLLTLNSNIGTGSDVVKFRVEADGDVISATNSYTSDERAKSEISDLNYGLDKIKQLQPKQFKMRYSEEKGFKYGFIAQEVETILPDLIRNDGIEDGEGGSYKALEYNSIIAILTKAIQELKSEIDSLKFQLNPDNSSSTQEPVVEEALEESVAEEAQPEEVATEEPQEVAQVSLGASISSTSLDDISNSRAEEL